MSFTALVTHSIFPTAVILRCSYIANTLSNRLAAASREYCQVTKTRPTYGMYRPLSRRPSMWGWFTSRGARTSPRMARSAFRLRRISRWALDTICLPSWGSRVSN